MARGDKKAAIMAELARNPKQSSAEVAARVGSTSRTVRAVASRLGIPFGRIGSRPNEDGEVKTYFRLEFGAVKWLRDEARRHNVSASEMLQAIITDARCEQ